jgi:hypothetical protein
MHSAFEPLLAALLIAAPFLFTFSDEGAPTAVSIVAGVVVLLMGMSTDWRLSLIKAIPVPAHMTMDFIIAAALVASPFLFGFSDRGAPTAFFIIVGIVLLLGVLATRWYPAKGGPDGGDARGGRMRRRRSAPADVPDGQPLG